MATPTEEFRCFGNRGEDGQTMSAAGQAERTNGGAFTVGERQAAVENVLARSAVSMERSKRAKH